MHVASRRRLRARRAIVSLALTAAVAAPVWAFAADPACAASSGQPVVACGATFAVGIRADGSHWSWGSNDRGQLGLGRPDVGSLLPQRVDIASDWTAVACGYDFVVALKGDGMLAKGTYAWKVFATDRAGTPQTKVGSNRLIVR